MIVVILSSWILIGNFSLLLGEAVAEDSLLSEDAIVMFILGPFAFWLVSMVSLIRLLENDERSS